MGNLVIQELGVEQSIHNANGNWFPSFARVSDIKYQHGCGASLKLTNGVGGLDLVRACCFEYILGGRGAGRKRRNKILQAALCQEGTGVLLMKFPPRRRRELFCRDLGRWDVASS